MRIYEAISKGVKKLKECNINNPYLDSEILMGQVLKKDRKYLILNIKKKLCINIIKKYFDLIEVRSLGKPVAYITGKKEFWNYEFKVKDGVLIPRPETEMIIDQVLKLTVNKTKLNILDIGVGSGCILLSILKEKREFLGTGVDISKKCIEISYLNSRNMNLKNRVKFFKTDIDNFNYGKYDLIISNPPYLKKLDFKYLDKDVANFEPKIALDGGVEGLSVIRKTIKKSSELIKKNGLFILEIAFDQKNIVKNLLRNKGFYINKILKDFANNDRCIISRKI
tara:strand:+ start:475 stop:1317 length:843 start_codon:yes stop_codon:yes gene_type:complete